jgi:PilZ domain-containing protein
MENDRRSAPRVRVNLAARWEGALHKESGTITDVSRNGCFVLSGGKVELKELVWIEIQLPDQPSVSFWAEVVDPAYEIGFALRFNAGDDEDHQRLADYIDHIFRTNPVKK